MVHAVSLMEARRNARKEIWEERNGHISKREEPELEIETFAKLFCWRLV